MRPCPRCGQLPAPLGTVSTDYDGTDNRHATFIEYATTHGHHNGVWHVYECRNSECGCGCRQYIPVRAVAAP